MDVIYTLIPAMILIGLAMVGVLIWAIRKGQYDDLEGDANRILMDDDDPLIPERDKTTPGSKKPNRPDLNGPDAE
ncbi:cbb3-type cytochrome oxidase assembly protein CcoS [Thiohalomonas denitrificans]|uniref:Cytochrome oxidase maturation protein, cbb3-type n=1 Tax=Thiohalomonas denitrificans TaxID=415747 RepID=A0A1G5QII4_9GAMM|nr:cbb3-type cytochrome oxidase assembly protein CcoS [Thiohalomonas denitrificans]SCZ60989.1 cytochrome oxidase maturation protein, cbb3-type [Thiohalomonas denitrificans]